VNRRAQVFEKIYRENAWNGPPDSASGPGSTLEATAELRERLPGLIELLGERHGIERVLDAGCGDSLWTPEIPAAYVGVDIASAAIERALERHPERTYLLADFCRDPLPFCDLVICRDALQHLSLLDGLSAVNNFRRAGARFLLATTTREISNVDVETGGWYETNLSGEPFFLLEEGWAIPDGTWASGVRFPRKLLALFRL